MDKQAAAKIIRDTFEKPFDKGRFITFSKNLVNYLDDSKNFTYRGNIIPDAYEPYIHTLERIGKYQDANDNKIDILIAQLKKETSLEHARTMQRNFIAWYLNGSRGGDLKDAALVAFVSPDSEDWRFSLVKMDYLLEESPSGKTKVKTELTPARRFSFLVGVNESSHTAQSQLVDILADDRNNPTLPTLQNAFNIEVATKEFFNRYRDLLYKVNEELDKLVARDKTISQEFDDNGIDTINFAKKLLGQIVFLYFLQKKGWLGVPENKNWGQGARKFLRNLFERCRREKRNFFNDYLEFLFYDALNRQDRGGIDPSYYHRFDCRIPFLNGGLFNSDYDWVKTDIVIPNDIFSNRKTASDEGSGILDIFDLYNFTVKEDEPLEKEVAVDPEMLGKVFENLLEVKARKSKGTYYTPREIVHYMCQESLINYLDTVINTGDVPLVHTPPPQGKLLGKPDPQQAALKTPQYRVLVPREDIEEFVRKGESTIEHDSRVESHGKETERYSYKLPESIRHNVKLVDEELANIRVCDPAVGSGAFLVGMMMEVVRARNTLTTYLADKEGRTNYNFKRHAIQNCLYGVDIDPGAVEIAKLRLWLSLVVDEEDIRQIQPLPNLDYKIVCGNSLLGVEKNLFNLELFNNLENLKSLYFNETNTKRKQEYRSQIDDLIRQITNDNENFDFEVYFSEIFHGDNKGFDVVIANPPYIEARGIQQKHVDTYRRLFKTAGNRVNTFAFFVEKGIELLNNERILSFIIHRNSIRSNDYRKLRKFILDNTKIKNILSFKIGVFEEVTGEVVVLVLQKTKNNQGNTIKVDFLNNTITQEFNYTLLEQDVFNNLPDYRFNIYLNRSRIQVLDNMNKHHRLEEFADVKQGIIVGNEKKYIKTYQQSSKYKPILRGKNVSKYRINFQGEYLYYVTGTRILTRGKTKDLFEIPEKILTQHVSSKIVAALDTNNYYYLQTINGITSKKETITNRYLLALLNSTLMNFYYEYTFNIGAEFTTAVAIENLNKLPFKEISRSAQQPFIDLVDKILAITKAEDYLANPTKQAKVKEYERQIDQMVYQLYDLTPDEIVVVEGSIK